MEEGTRDVPPLDGSALDRGRIAPPCVVAIACSASGSAELREFFAAVPGEAETAFVVLPIPDVDGSLPPMERDLASATSMPIRRIDAGTPIAPATIFVAPPGRLVTLDGNRLQLNTPSATEVVLPIDRFFRSVAEQKEERSIGVILAGPGSDGALGLRAIEAAGGITLVQNPEGIDDQQLLRAAIATGVVDYVVPAARMPEIIHRYTQHPYVQSPDEAVDGEGLEAILAILRTRPGYSFHSYKTSTLGRRVQRRLGLGQFTSFSDYAEFLRNNPTELDELFRDLLIRVTQFFRDRAAWEMLRSEVIEEIVRRRGDGGSVRVWTPGCATGEEAYTLAILLLDEVRRQKKTCTVQVFASDISEHVLSVARIGQYPLSIASDVPRAYLERYFEEATDEHHYAVSKLVRESVVFAQQNLITDPPFAKLDLVVCRNLLIYLQPAVQQKILTLFHFALRQGGFLFLGSAETIGRLDGLFAPISTKWQLYRRLDSERELLEQPAATTRRRPLFAGSAPVPAAPVDQKAMRLVQQLLLEQFAPAAVLVNERFDVLYFSGPTTDYLVQPTGTPTNNLLAMAREGIRVKLRTVLQTALRTAQPATATDVRIRVRGVVCPTKITVNPLRSERGGAPLLLVVFENQPPEPTAPANADGDAVDETLVRQLEYELRLTREDLQSHIEELETSNEELKAVSEEVMSVNEELRSTNGELEISKERLQSLNEELTAVNRELKEKLDEIQRINGDLSNLLTSTDIATIFLDRSLAIKRFTPTVRDLLDITPSDIGRPIVEVTPRFNDPDLPADLRAVLERLAPSETEVRTEAGRWYLRRVMPYRTDEDRIDGLVITFVDITELRQAADALAISENRYRMLVDSTTDFAIFLIDVDGRITTWNTGAERICGFAERETLGRPFSIIFVPEDLATGEDTKELARAREHGRSIDERWHQRKDGTRFWGSGVVTSIYDTDGQLHGFAKVMRDQTERRGMESELTKLNETLEQMVQERTAALRALSSELLLAEERERRELAGDLHDTIGQTLALAAIRLREISGASDDAARRDLLALIGQANDAVRSVTMQLSPPILYQIGLVPALEWLAEEMERRYALSVVLESRPIPQAIDEQVRFILFRSARELLINVAKHAGVADARVRIGSTDDDIVLEVEDNGIGFEASGEILTRRGGFGLFSLRERLGYIGGEVIIRSTPGIGTAVVLRAPSRIRQYTKE